MKLDQETLIKHRFWFVLGLLVPLVLLAIVLLWTDVASAVDKKQKEVVDAEGKLQKITDPKNPSWLDALQDRETKAEEKKKEIWAQAWKSQEALMTWPGLLQQKLRIKNWYFGEDIPQEDCDRYWLELYSDQVEEVVKIVDPVDAKGERGLVQYPGGDWHNIIRYVQAWTKKPPTTEDITLAQEDLWVQHGLLLAVRNANDTAATFRNTLREEIDQLNKSLAEKRKELQSIKKELDDPDAEVKLGGDIQTKRDRQAELEKQIKADEAALAPVQARARPDAAKGERDRQTFTSLSWKLELVLAQNEKTEPTLRGRLTNIGPRRQTLDFRLRVSLVGATNPTYLSAGGEPLAPGHSTNLKEEVVRGANPRALDRVEQVLDWRTAPVKRIEQMVFGLPEAFSHRTAERARVLKRYPAFEPKTEASPDDQGTGDTGFAGKLGAMAGPGGGVPGPGGMDDRREALGGMFRGMGMIGAAAGDTTPNGLIRSRYLDTGQTVRRMPVAMVLVIDQAYLPDVVTAFANSPLRIQVTQVEWRHFPRGASIKPVRVESETPESTTEERRPITRLPGPGGFRKFEPGGVPMPGSYRPPTGLESASETGPDELAPNLITVAIYGIASLYERYPPKVQEPAPDSGATPNK